MDIILTPTFALNVILGVLFFILIVFLMDVYTDYQKEKELYGLGNKKFRKDIIRNNKFFKKYDNTIKRFLSERNKERYSALVFYGTMAVALAIFLYFISMKQVLLGVIAPISLIWVANKIMTMLLVDVNEKVDEQLPYVIDTIIKVFSKYGDLKSVVYETSQSVEEPLKSKFERLARKMLSENNQEKAFMEFADEMDNIWVYSLVFILLSYKEETKKEDVILNLRHLSTIIEKENSLKNAGITDKKYGVVLNYAIAIIAFVGGFANIVFNPIGKEFFFGSMTGIFCFVVGMASIVGTIMINIKLSSKKGRK
ncbi:pilus assembly protein TadB [Bacillus sp. M6-12]|uniref:pilus assembly protein TadB n=1 Tax=Bacillus sp. M6-12 TaxID=2054166 RepID=UPI000C7691A5|nr:pilus assembly protein TadB [Bacillus sp. M6-12]PLS19742.1 pilus assembly protein TadB [Bacillus sp. M6-12]